MNSTGLEARSVVVTGAGSGIGRATALRFAGEGAKVLVADRGAEEAAETVRDVEAAGGVARAVVGDLSDPKVVDEVTATAVEAFGGLDVLVNNAGIGDTMSALADIDDAEWERLIRVNLTAPFLLTRAVLPHMLAAARGAIVFTASEAALRGGASGLAYTAAKHGVVGMVRSLAVMYRGQGIRANAVAPGGTQTNILASSMGDDPEKFAALMKTLAADSAQNDLGEAPHGPTVLREILFANASRMTTPEEQAAAIVFLASDGAAAINGVVLPVDDGWSAV